MKKALIAAAVAADAVIVVYLAGNILAAVGFIVFVAAFLLPACALVLRLPPLRPMPPDLRLIAAGVLVVLLVVPWFFVRKLLPFSPWIADAAMCAILVAAAAKLGAFRSALGELASAWRLSWFLVLVALPLLSALTWLGYEVHAGAEVLFHGLFGIDFGNLVTVVASLRASPSLPLVGLTGAGPMNYHWLYFTLPAMLADFGGIAIPASNALILVNTLMAALLVHTLAAVVRVFRPQCSDQTIRWTVAVTLFASFTVYYYQAVAARVALGWLAMPTRNHLLLSPLNSMTVFGNNTFALVLVLFAALEVERWNRERRAADLVLGIVAVSMVIGYSATLLVPLAAALMIWLAMGRIARPLMVLIAAVIFGGAAIAMFVAIGVLGSGDSRHTAVAWDHGQFLRMAILGMLPLWALLVIAGKKPLNFFHVLIGTAIAAPSFLYVAGSVTGRVDFSMKTGSLLAIAFAPLIADPIDRWMRGTLPRWQAIGAALLVALGLVQTSVYVLQFPYYRITNSRVRRVALPLDYYDALVWIRDHTPPRSIVVDAGGLTLRDENPTLWIGERRGWLPTPNSEAFLSPLHSDVAHRVDVWADFIRDPASTSAGVIASQADYLMIPRAIQSPFWIPVSRTGSWWIYQSVRTRSAQTSGG
ncbi:MAG: hypothetical protein QOI58_502 [Thermoanaerobaculia bacterium]|jgi:hypothetical protein|nr:hypothetical protein [Thermoanaerobaculia bacterium]